jgi:hypothetical protein
MSYIPQNAAIYTWINYEKTNGISGKKPEERECLENTLKRRKGKERKKIILTDDVIISQREQPSFYSYREIVIEKENTGKTICL